MEIRAKAWMAAAAVAAMIWMPGCASPGKGTKIGAGAGAVTGGVIGGVAGGAKGAAIGAVAGGAVGAAVGNTIDKQKRELGKVAETERTRDGLLVKLNNDLLFSSGKADVKDESKDQLEQLGQILARYPQDQIRVVGHTDSVGTPEFNQKLSEKRADQVKEILSDQGVKSAQIAAIGEGESAPIASNQTSRGRQQNRRVELRIVVPTA
jgi:outer membrane protein OmpA-like peptidoglycan-associated protein